MKITRNQFLKLIPAAALTLTGCGSKTQPANTESLVFSHHYQLDYAQPVSYTHLDVYKRQPYEPYRLFELRTQFFQMRTEQSSSHCANLIVTLPQETFPLGEPTTLCRPQG